MKVLKFHNIRKDESYMAESRNFLPKKKTSLTTKDGRRWCIYAKATNIIQLIIKILWYFLEFSQN